jgi:hypothetical protein
MRADGNLWHASELISLAHKSLKRDFERGLPKNKEFNATPNHEH